MAEYDDREHFIPLRCTDLVQLLCDERSPSGGNTLSEADQTRLRHFSRLVGAHFHTFYHDQLIELKDSYASFDPDSDTKPLKALDESQRDKAQIDMFGLIGGLLAKANYTHMNREEIEKVMSGSSDWGIDMHVDWGVFDQIEIYYRGNAMVSRFRRSLMTLFRKVERKVPTFKRMVVILRQNPHKLLGKEADTKNIFVKMFKEIPQMDMEMVLPGTRMKMPKLEKGKLGVSLLSTFGAMIWKGYVLFSLGLAAIASVFSIAFLMPVAIIFGYGYKQYSSYQVTKQTYQFKLTQTLYYQTLDHNAGVLFRLLDEAEEQECREAILGYFYLWRYAGNDGWTAESLDDYVELELEKRLNMKVDFEIGDAIDKLERIGLVDKTGDRYRAIPLDQAIAKLERSGTEQFQTV